MSTYAILADLVLGTLPTLSVLQNIVMATHLAPVQVLKDTVSEAGGIMVAMRTATVDQGGQRNREE